MAEYLYVELRTQEQPYYLRVDDASLQLVDSRCRDLNQAIDEVKVRTEARRISRAVPMETAAGHVLVPVR